MPKPTCALLLLVLAACQTPPAPVPTFAVTATAVDAGLEKPSAAPIVADGHPEPIAASDDERASPAVATPAPMPLPEAWAWLRAELPKETALLRPTEETRGLLDQLLSWTAPGKTVDLYDRSCRRLRLVRNEDSFDGAIHVKTVVRGETKTVSADSIAFTDFISVVCGSTIGYERTAEGWVETSVSATGCESLVGHQLSKVTDTAVWYGGEVASIALKCGLRSEEEQRCQDGSARTCGVCNRIALEVTSRQMGTRTGSSTARSAVPGPAVDCTVPCPPDEKGAQLARASAALEGVELLQVEPNEHPTLFRTRAACLEYGATHAISAADREQW